ncbi:MAG: branched-chain amino acid transporter permease [Oscillospiraceae bacterium]|nr:branched-chain amino acid transporter permease [Oscillospiraceae bacterium]
MKNKSITKSLIGLVSVAVAYVLIKILMLPQVNVINPFYQTIVLKMFIDITLALGLNLITGITGQFSLGHAGFMSIGAYSAALFVMKTSDSLLNVLLAALIGACAAAFIGFLIGIPTLRLKGDYLAIATLGLGEIIRIVVQNVDQNLLGGAAGLSGIPLYTNFEVVFFGAVITFIVIRNLLKSSFGRACIAVREDEIAAESMGINLTNIKILAFVVGTFFAGLAGAMYSGYVGVIQPKDFGFMKSIDILMIVVLGGLGNIWGTVIAAIALNVLSVALQDFAEVRMIIYAALLVLIMLFKSGESPLFVKLRRIFSLPKLKLSMFSKK